MDPLEAEEMFNFADKDRDSRWAGWAEMTSALRRSEISDLISDLRAVLERKGGREEGCIVVFRISWEEFQIMINPPPPPKPPTPHKVSCYIRPDLTRPDLT